MSVGKKFLTGNNITAVLECYRSSAKPTAKEVADLYGTTFQTVIYILKNHMPPAEYAQEKRLRYRRSKLGEKNPMRGKSGVQHHNWVGDVEDQKGYLTRKVGKRRYFVHRIVMAEALGVPVESLSRKFAVHHIDHNPMNNALENLALLTLAAHSRMHRPSTASSHSGHKGSGTSKSKKTTRT